MRPRRLWLALGAAAAALAVLAGGVGASGKAKLTIGFLYVGAKDDYGYNQAAYKGSLAVEKAFPDANVLQAENIPETEVAAQVMEGMIAKGASIVFPTSYGHLDPALEVAKRHDDVLFFHQGLASPRAPNR